MPSLPNGWPMINKQMTEAIASLVAISDIADVYALLEEVKYQYATQCVQRLRYHEHAARVLDISVPTLRSWLRLDKKSA